MTFSMIYKNKIFKYIFLSFFYLILGVVFSYPLVANFTTKYPNGYIEYPNPIVWGDHLQLIAGAREHRNNIQNLIQGKPVYNKEYCFDNLESCRLSTISVVEKIAFSPYWPQTVLSFLKNDIISHNIVMLASFVTTGLTGYFLTREFISKKVQVLSPFLTELYCVWGSLFFVLASKRMIHLFGGQKLGYLVFLLGLVMLFCERLIKRYRQKKVANEEGIKPSAKTGMLNFWRKIQNQTFISIILIYISTTEQFLLLYSLFFIGFRIVWYEIFEYKIIEKIKSLSVSNKFKQYFWFVFLIIATYLLNFFTKIEDIQGSIIAKGHSLEIIQYNSAFIGNLWSLDIYGFEEHIYVGAGLTLLVIALFLGIYNIFRYRKTSTFLFYFLFCFLMITISLGVNTPLYSFLYDNFPTFNYSRTPTKSMFALYPSLCILAGMLSNYFLRWYADFNFSNLIHNLKIQKTIKNFCFIVFFLLSIYSFHSKHNISLSRLPEYKNEIADNKKILFLPLTTAEDPHGAINEYFLSFNNATSMNGYDPFPSIREKEFVDQYGYILNIGVMERNELKFFLAQYSIDQIVVLRDFYNSSRIPVPKLELISNDLENTEKMLENSGLFEKSSASSDNIFVYNVKDDIFDFQ